MKRYTYHMPKQTITTKYLPPTATRPARIKATTTSGLSAVRPAGIYGDVNVDAHADAALALVDAMGLRWDFMVGGWHGIGVMVWVDTTGPVITATAEDERQ